MAMKRFAVLQQQWIKVAGDYASYTEVMFAGTIEEGSTIILPNGDKLPAIEGEYTGEYEVVESQKYKVGDAW